MEDYFKTESIHCEGSCFFDVSAEGQRCSLRRDLFTAGPDDIIYHRNLNTGDSERTDYDSTATSSLEAIAVHPTESGVLAVARENFVGLTQSKDASQTEEIYSLKGRVNWITFSPSGALLAIGCEEPLMVVYNLARKKAVKCRPGHSNSVLSVMFSPDEKYVCSTSLDGNLKIYRFDAQLDPQLAYTLQVCPPTDISSDLVAAFNPESTMIAVPGKPILQLVEYKDVSFRALAVPNVKHDRAITICYWFSSHVLITGGLDNTIALWNMNKRQRITYVPACSLRIMKRFGNTFYGIDRMGTLFEFLRTDLLTVVVEVAPPVEVVHEHQSDEANPFEDKQVADLHNQQRPVHTKVAPKEELLPVDRLITCLPQPELTTACEMKDQSRFLLYNETACIVEYDTGVKTVQVEYHDMTVLFKRKRLFSGREVRCVALCGMSLAYCTKTDLGFVGEVDWEIETEDILEVTLGSGWVAGLSDEDIFIFDFAGNCTNRIGIDRQNVAMRGYEDILVVVYHDSVPMEGCQSLRMRIYNVGSDSVSIKEESAVPITFRSTLKTFGMSSKGMIYSQDSLDKIRVYQFGKSEWTLILDPTAEEQPPKHTNWIVDIDGNNLSAIHLPEGQIEPAVTPKPAPRSIRISMPWVCKLHPKLGELLWRACWLEHERFRTRTWYKYKYSRSRDNPFYFLSSSILTDEELETRQRQLESEMLVLANGMVASGEEKKAMNFCKHHVKHNRSEALRVFEEAPGCGPLAVRLRQHYNQQADQQKYLAKLQKHALQLNLKMETDLALLGLTLPTRKIDPLLPRKKKLKEEELQELLARDFSQLIPL